MNIKKNVSTNVSYETKKIIFGGKIQDEIKKRKVF